MQVKTSTSAGIAWTPRDSKNPAEILPSKRPAPSAERFSRPNLERLRVQAESNSARPARWPPPRAETLRRGREQGLPRLQRMRRGRRMVAILRPLKLLTRPHPPPPPTPSLHPPPPPSPSAPSNSQACQQPQQLRTAQTPIWSRQTLLGVLGREARGPHFVHLPEGDPQMIGRRVWRGRPSLQTRALAPELRRRRPHSA